MMILERIYTPYGTYGQLGNIQTLERPWLDNKPFVSCIPEGVYICKRVDSPKFGDTFEVTNVDGRTHILFHIANEVHELQGCIALGRAIRKTATSLSLNDSRLAFNEFKDKLSGKDMFELEIRGFKNDR